MNEKTIADKLYLKNARSLAVINAGVNAAIAAQLPSELMDAQTEAADVVLMFAQNQDQLAKHLPEALERMGDKSSLWIAFLKHSAPKATDIDRDRVAAYAKEHGATAVAMASLDSDWSALRLKRM